MPAHVSDRSQRAAREPSPAPGGAARRPHTREAILRTGLRLVDQEGLEALTMRKLAQELRIDPMTIYRHFQNKEALLGGLAEMLWAEVEVPDADDWEAVLESLARSLRGVAHAHPHAYLLLCQCPTLPTAMLCLFSGALERLQQAGFDRSHAADAVRAVYSYAIGYAMMELPVRQLTQPAAPTPGPTTEFERIAQVMRALPRDTPPHLGEVAYLLCADCDLDVQFAFGLDLLLTGLRARQRKR